jgi:hypothetical protein
VTGARHPHMARASAPAIAERIAVLSPEECAVLTESYTEERPSRSRIVMAHHGFGRGEYKYFHDTR